MQDRAHEQQHRNGGVQDLVAVRQRAVHAMENRSHLLDADASGQDAQAGEEKCHADEHDRHRQAGEERRCETGKHQCRQEKAHLAASVMIARRAEAMLASIKWKKPPGNVVSLRRLESMLLIPKSSITIMRRVLCPYR